MEVKLLNHNPDALELLLYTKNTRLDGAGSLDDIKAWPMEKKMEHLGYMLDTIKSSWEFSYYVFEIKGVTRAFTHQLVRTRTASFAQQAQRVCDVRDMDWSTPEKLTHHQRVMFDKAMGEALDVYAELVDDGAARQDARGVVPTNIHTNIIVGANLRTLSSMAELRLCFRTQGEYQEAFKRMRDEVLKVHPWAEKFLQVYCAAHGTCAFPRYTECPIQEYTFEALLRENGLDPVRMKALIGAAWAETKHEASPTAFQGATDDGGCTCGTSVNPNCPIHGEKE